MTAFNLPENFKENPLDFFRSVKPRVVAPQKTHPTKKPIIPAPPTFKIMADKTLSEFVAPSADNVATGLQINMGDVDLNLKSSLITMALASPFCGKLNEDANSHLQQFLEICNSYTMKGVAAGGTFFSKTVRGAVDLIEKMVSNMGWSEERLQTRQRGMHIVKETGMLAAKLDLLMKRLDDHEKRPQGSIKALDSHVTCEVYGSTGHSGNDYPETREDVMYMGNNNGFHPQGGQGWNQPRPYYQGVPAAESGRIPGQSEPSVENVKAITTRGALCDLGASVSVMPKDVFDKLNFTMLAPRPMRLQLADSSVRYHARIAEDVPVKIRDFFIPVDFVVLDMDTEKEMPLILGPPLLSTADANIGVGIGSIRFRINRKKEKFEFQPRTEQCSMVQIKYGPNP
uniref:Retrotransposon-like protein n=2 Tax=Oryza sativa subsp. japonica TaxID=39947 RepID=Q7G4J1_ORYSJ|nr:putative retrotransposon-like protein [Oryza sativa Japonica Group]AAP52590.1 hypothetical protein LOC_Os10g11740 [Oryza sativa Japonica Group]